MSQKGVKYNLMEWNGMEGKAQSCNVTHTTQRNAVQCNTCKHSNPRRPAFFRIYPFRYMDSLIDRWKERKKEKQIERKDERRRRETDRRAGRQTDREIGKNIG